MAPSHRQGPLKQQNKKHKREKKRSDIKGVKSGSTIKSRCQSKRERRLAAKQRRLHKVSELKKYLSYRGSEVCPIFCVIAPLTDSVPVHLAQLLLRNCDPDAVDIEDADASLQRAMHFRSPLLNKHVTLVTAQADDLFGCLDLAQLADWLILVVPSDCSNLDASAERFLTALYAQGLVNTSFVVLSSSCNLRDLRDNVETKFAIPEGMVHPLNTNAQALNLLRHICSSNVLGATGKLSKHKETIAATEAHSSARFRAGMLVRSIRLTGQLVPDKDVTPTSQYVYVTGQLKGAPLFLFEPLEQSSPDRIVGPSVHLPGWGDFPLAAAKWSDPLAGSQCWSLDRSNIADKAFGPSDLLNVIGDSDDQSDDSGDLDSPMQEGSDLDNEGEHDHARLVQRGNTDTVPTIPTTMGHNEDATVLTESTLPSSSMPDEAEDDDWGLDDAMTSYAARTMASSKGSVFSTAQLTKFRAARMEEMFPDEVETPPNVPARDRFAKYRSLPRFQGSVWPVEKDSLPSPYENVAGFKNYHRNRRSIIRYIQQRLVRVSSQQPSARDCAQTQTLKHIPAGSFVELALGPMPAQVASLILKHHTVIQPDSVSKAPPPLVLWSLLPHESRISVCHFTMHRLASALRAGTDMAVVAAAATKAAEEAERAAQSQDDHVSLELGEEAVSRLELEEEQIRQALAEHQKQKQGGSHKTSINTENPVLPPEVEPIKSKELMLFQVGIRRFVSAPIYSNVTTSPHEKAKFEPFFSTLQTDMIASVYAPVMYSPANVLQFRIRVDEDEHGDVGAPYVGELVATGSLHSVDPSRLIIKRIFLSGHPYKIRQRQAVVRFMFFNPVDVEFFKVAPLQTKHGAIGHIKEPVGTHGLMKCVFDRPLNAADVVLMPLYKRVFPKWVYEPQIMKLTHLANQRPSAPQCYWGEETLQLRPKTHRTKVPNEELDNGDHQLMSVFD